MSDAQRIMAAVAVMAYDAGESDVIHRTLDGVLSHQEALLHAVWIGGELARQVARATGQPLGDVLAQLADRYQE
jgi:hypothetical protein